jgi:pseudouridine-5'-phosphate glycosidase
LKEINTMPDWSAWMDISDEVQAALDKGGPVLAFESTIITHGMPYPQNFETALAVEQVCRQEGAVAATIAILNGRIKVGLSHAELEDLAQNNQDSIKASRRDLPFVIASGSSGGTTVAATMIIAGMAGIRVFATGGIGGVHRGAESSMDVSADLEELARTDVTVICAGPKSILDIGLTLEYLETKGVAVVGYQTDELPAFFTRESGFEVDYRLDSIALIAEAVHVKRGLGLGGGMLIANPIPVQFAMDSNHINDFIDRATVEASNLGVKGKNLTPYLLQRIYEFSDGASLDANIQLVINNARLGAKIAVASAKRDQPQP